LWIRKHLPSTCKICGKPLDSIELEGVLYPFHPECYWRRVEGGETPVYVESRLLQSDPIKTPNLPCLRGRFKIDLTDGCYHNCIYCYTYSQPRTGLPRGMVLIRRNIVEKVSRQIAKLSFVKPIYISPNCDPFQEVVRGEVKGLVEVLVREGLPFYFVTKGAIPKEVLDMVNGHPYIDAQISLTTLDEDTREVTEPNAPPVKERLKGIERLKEVGVKPILRIDPLLPYITDDEEGLKDLLKTVIDLGVRHVIGSYVGMRPEILSYLTHFLEARGMGEVAQRYRDLFQSGDSPIVYNFHLAPIKYRYKRLRWLSQEVKKIGKGRVTFSTCMEEGPKETLFKSLWTTNVCEPVQLPTFKRVRNHFKPVKECIDCLTRICEKCFHIHHPYTKNLLDYS